MYEELRCHPEASVGITLAASGGGSLRGDARMMKYWRLFSNGSASVWFRSGRSLSAVSSSLLAARYSLNQLLCKRDGGERGRWSEGDRWREASGGGGRGRDERERQRAGAMQTW